MRTLIADNLTLDHDPDFDRPFSDAGVSSLEAVAFFKLVNEAFGLELVQEDCLQFKTLRDLVTFIDARA
ncbi:MAG: acyl carrier protein [Gemmatimonadetes bacterium]|nr:acyl carrier protein [Gemmatimonadota bacterium]